MIDEQEVTSVWGTVVGIDRTATNRQARQETRIVAHSDHLDRSEVKVCA